MMRSLLGVSLSLGLFAATSSAQSSPCSLSDHTEYSRKIKEFTTERETMGSYFLVFNAILNFDHLDAGSAAKPTASSASSTAAADNANE